MAIWKVRNVKIMAQDLMYSEDKKPGRNRAKNIKMTAEDTTWQQVNNSIYAVNKRTSSAPAADHGVVHPVTCVYVNDLVKSNSSDQTLAPGLALYVEWIFRLIYNFLVRLWKKNKL